MAFTQLTSDLNIIQALSDLPNQTEGLTSAQLKAEFDESGNTIKVYLNSTLIGELEGTGAAGNIGLVTITGVTATNIQEALEDLKNQIDGVAVGAIPDASLTASKLVDDVVFIDYNLFTTTNVGNAYSITTGRSLSAITAGYEFKIKVNADASGNTTLNVDTLGAVNILKANGSNVTNLKQDGIYTVVYDGTSFILQGEGGEGTALIADVLTGETFTNDTGDTLTGTMPNRAGDTVALSSNVNGTTLELLASDGYRDGVDDNVTITDADFVAGNILSGVNLFGLAGTYSNVKSVQQITLVNPFNDTSTTIVNQAITSVDSNTSIVTISFTSGTNQCDVGIFSAQLTSNTNVRIQRGSASLASVGDVTIRVIEYNNIASIQRGSIGLNVSGSVNQTISSIDTSKSFVTKSFRHTLSGTPILDDFFIQDTITSTTNINFSGKTQSGLQTIEWQVIEFN